MVFHKPRGEPSRAYGADMVSRILWNHQREVDEGLREDLIDWPALKKKGKVKVGHFGTLDPEASGLLPVAYGNATRVATHLKLTPKVYKARLCLGTATTSGDVDGQVVETRQVPSLPGDEELQSICFDNFVGRIVQRPPKYSAIHVNGVRAYELARNNVEFEMPTRQVTVYEMLSSKVPGSDNLIDLDITCASGTYIRTLGEDLARKLGTVGHLASLHRSKSGILSLQENSHALSPEEVEAYNNKPLNYTTVELMRLFPRLTIDLPVKKLAERVMRGRKLNTLLTDSLTTPEFGPNALFSAESDIPIALMDVFGKNKRDVKFLVNFWGKNGNWIGV